MTNYCKGCCSPAPKPAGTIGDAPVSERCSHCPPIVCDSCVQLDSMAEPCSCWVSFDGMPLADIKAIFARDGAFNLGGLDVTRL